MNPRTPAASRPEPAVFLRLAVPLAIITFAVIGTLCMDRLGNVSAAFSDFQIASASSR